MQKFLWLICGALFVILASFFVIDQINLFNQKQEKNAVIKINNDHKDLLVPAVLPRQKAGAPSFTVAAKAAYLVDLPSMVPMYVKNENEQLPIASTTKIATAMVILDDYKDHLDDIVTITSSMTKVEPSIIGLKDGEKISVKNLLFGMLIMSGNDAAYSLADYFGGREKFVQEMNQKVLQIGLKNTVYKDPAGLNDEGLSTSKDLAILAAYAFTHSQFADIVGSPNKIISSMDGQITHNLTNTNKLILPDDQFYYANVLGGKTGFTNSAGRVLVSVAGKDGHKILSVIIDADDKSVYGAISETKKLLEWGFSNWDW